MCRRLRQQCATRAARVVAVTGRGQDADRRASAEAGFDAHLVKPVSAETLLALARDTPRLP